MTTATITELNKKLPEDRVKVFGAKAGAKSGLAYLEGHDVIRELNSVFNFAWSHSVERLEQITEYDHTNKYDKEMFSVAYLCVVNISVCIGDSFVHHSGVGTGSSTMGVYSRMDAMEVAMKEAETDALKRAAIKLGDRFGLALYDKEKPNVEKAYNPEEYKAKVFADVVREHGLEKQDAILHLVNSITTVVGEKAEFNRLDKEVAEKVHKHALETKFEKEQVTDE